MSLSCREFLPVWRVAAAVSMAAALASPGARAADGYFVPAVSVEGMYHTNRQLVPDVLSPDSVTGYRGTFGALFGTRTPRSTTDVRPQLSVSRYPDAADLDQTEGMFDFRSIFQGQKTRATLFGKYSRLDEYTAEFGNVEFDEFDPNAPQVAGSGVVLRSETRTRVEVRPGIEVQLTPLTGVGLDLLVRDVSYESDRVVSQRDYQNWDADLHLSRRLNQVSTLSVGAFATHYQTEDDLYTSDGYGLSSTLRQRWSDTFTLDVMLRVEDLQTELGNPVSSTENSTQWSLTTGLNWRGQVTRVRLSAGRSLTPSGGGDVLVYDQFRAQIDRDLTQRLMWRNAVRATSQNAQDNAQTSSERDTARFETSMEWKMSTTWSLRAGATYTWQDRASAGGSAEDTAAFLSLGYRGLDPTRR
jgi:hypothetical protein